MKGSHENTFDNQNESDPLIEDLEVALAALREELHVRAENAGSIVGPVVLGDDGDRVGCARLGKGGYSVPSIVEPEYIEIRRCTADSCSSRRAPSGTASRRTSSGAGTTASS